MLKRLLPIVVVVLAANAAALGLAARNRAGAPDATLKLTERELRITNRASDTTGMTLTFQWDRSAAMTWFDRAKLVSLGFDCSMPLDDRRSIEYYSTPGVLPRAAYVVFEYDPDRPVDEAQRLVSRLRPVDAGADPKALRVRYADRSRYLITAGTVRAVLVRPPGNQPARLQGQVLWADPILIYVPEEMQATVARAAGYEITVEYGSRWLPRITGAVSRQ